MRIVSAVSAAIALLGLCVAAQGVVIDTVRVGDAGNVGEWSGYAASPSRICGAVNYDYNIGKYEVTVAQYCEFLNAKAKTDSIFLWTSSMSQAGPGPNIQRSSGADGFHYTIGNGSASDLAAWGNKPATYVSYWSALRFANWLNNGQGAGDTETGAYTLNGYYGQDGRSIVRNSGWNFALASEDEWYKAAYYDPNKPGGAGYWDYAVRSDSINTTKANYNVVGHPTDVGSYAYASAYGTFDQSGNVGEKTEGIVESGPDWMVHCVRGGGFYSPANAIDLQARYRGASGPNGGSSGTGFRVVQAVPEPCSLLALAGGLVGLVGMRRRRG